MASGEFSQGASSQLLIYVDGAARIQVRVDGDTVWLTQAQMAKLYDTTKQNVSLHIRNILAEGELSAGATVKSYLTVQIEGPRSVRRPVEHYSLEMILAVGYRVRSIQGTRFRRWATSRLQEILVKGFSLDDERIKAGRTIGQSYFDELLARIRDIRSSERLFYQKIADIFATSIDYEPNSDLTRTFYQTVQNKLHFAAHGQTAAEVVRSRANASLPNMGLTSWKNAPSGPVRKLDVNIAKNYLSQSELETLNRLVSTYLEFAELQARNRRAMSMRDWAIKLDEFLRFVDRPVLPNAGIVSHQAADEHAEAEFQRFDSRRLASEADSLHTLDSLAASVAELASPPPSKRTAKPRKRRL